MKLRAYNINYETPIDGPLPPAAPPEEVEVEINNDDWADMDAYEKHEAVREYVSEETGWLATDLSYKKI